MISGESEGEVSTDSEIEEEHENAISNGSKNSALVSHTYIVTDERSGPLLDCSPLTQDLELSLID